MPSRDATVPVDRQCELRRGGLLVAGHIGELRQFRQRVLHDRRPLVQLAEIDVGQRVLVLRRGQPAADVDVLHRLHEQPHPDTPRISWPSRAMTWLIGGRWTRGFSAMKIRPWFSVEVAPPAPI